MPGTHRYRKIGENQQTMGMKTADSPSTPFQQETDVIDGIDGNSLISLVFRVL